MPKILFTHKSFPGQFRSLIPHLVRQGWDVTFLSNDETLPRNGMKRFSEHVRAMGIDPHREPAEGVHRFTLPAERAVIFGQALAQAMIQLRNADYRPDIVVGHTGWVPPGMARVVWPDVPVVPYLEWWYRYPARDVPESFDDPDPYDARAQAHLRNLPFWIDIADAAAILAPTAFQVAEVPEILRPLIRVEHDGVDCDAFSPGPAPAFEALGLGIPEGATVVTYATRGMEPMRGFPEFMAAISRVMADHPALHVVIAGEDSIHYGAKLPEGESFKARALAEHAYDHDRLHFTGKLPLETYRDLLRRSDVHVTLTLPFVLSWSVVEAMATGCALVVSDNDTIREALPTDDLAAHVDHHDIEALTAAISGLVADPGARARLGAAARAHATAHFDMDKLLPRKEQFLREVAERAKAGGAAATAGENSAA